MERSTRQRQAIRRVLEEEARPLAPLELLEAAQQYVPQLGVATVYRTLKSMVQEGVVTQVDLPGALPHYEVTRRVHHHHFHCRSCTSIYEIDTCSQNLRLLTPAGFEVDGHEVILYGVCANCTPPSRQ